MMMNLFSVFDPSSYYLMHLNWFICFLVFMFLPMGYYIMESGFLQFYKSMYNLVYNMFNEIGSSNSKAISFVCVSSFVYLCIVNVIGLFPFIFTMSAHPMFTMGLGLVFWLSYFIMGWGKSLSNSAAHLVPEGSPFLLSPLMVVIESISHLIRPFTLSIRLAANMMAGHLIVGLLSSVSLLSFNGMVCSIFMQSLLMILEFGVAVIQSFVFSILLLLYALEYY